MKHFFSLLIFLSFLIPGTLFSQSQKIRGEVVFVREDRFYFDIGETTGIRPEMPLVVYRRGTEIRHPKTGALLGYDEEKIGEGKVLFVRPNISAGVLTDSQISQVQVGDLVEVQLAPVPLEQTITGQTIYRSKPQNPDILASYTIDNFDLVDLTVGDFNGDGEYEIAVANKDSLVFLKYYGAKLIEFYRYEGPWNAKFIQIDAGDVNNDHRDELYVMSQPGNFVQLLVYQMKEGPELQEILKLKDIHVKVLNYNRETILVGQQYGFTMPFYRDVFRLIWSGHKLVPSKFKLPRVDSVYSLEPFDFTGDGLDEFAALDKDDYLRIYRGGGKQIFKSSEKFGGSAIKIIARDRKTPAYVEDFIRSYDVDGNGNEELIVAKNIRAMGGGLLQLKSGLNPFKDSQLLALRFNGDSLEALWETQRLGGYIAGFEIFDVNRDGLNDLIVGLRKKKEGSSGFSLLHRKKNVETTVKIFDIKRLQTQPESSSQ